MEYATLVMGRGRSSELSDNVSGILYIREWFNRLGTKTRIVRKSVVYNMGLIYFRTRSSVEHICVTHLKPGEDDFRRLTVIRETVSAQVFLQRSEHVKITGCQYKAV